MTCGRRGRLLILGLLLAAPVLWYAALGPESRYLLRHPMAGDPRALSPVDRPEGCLRVLFIGNSFTRYWGGQSALGMALAQSSAAGRERRAIYEQVTGNGFDLRDHWESGRAAERIREGHWDYVVLQDHSEGPLVHRAAFIQYARLLDAQIKRAGAKTVLFMTWAKASEPGNQTPLAEAYEGLGRELGAEVVAVGRAFAQSQAARPELKLYDPDGKHPARVGSYLTACCFYGFFYRQSPVGLSRAIFDPGPKGAAINEPDARYLQELAYRIVGPRQPE
jgi:hypothetical protein